MTTTKTPKNASSQTHLNPINCSVGGAVLAGCAAFVVLVLASSHHSGKAARKLEKLSVEAKGKEEDKAD